VLVQRNNRRIEIDETREVVIRPYLQPAEQTRKKAKKKQQPELMSRIRHITIGLRRPDPSLAAFHF
jgi:hypothetical protein